jgi:DNA-binding XRE family transcriptional regulator
MYRLYIKKYRLLRGMTQVELAFRINVSQSLIAQLEKDNVIRTKSPRLIILLKICEVLKVCYNDIIHYECSNCSMSETCLKRQYIHDDYDFFEENVQYYL